MKNKVYKLITKKFLKQDVRVIKTNIKWVKIFLILTHFLVDKR